MDVACVVCVLVDGTLRADFDLLEDTASEVRFLYTCLFRVRCEFTLRGSRSRSRSRSRCDLCLETVDVVAFVVVLLVVFVIVETTLLRDILTVGAAEGAFDRIISARFP